MTSALTIPPEAVVRPRPAHCPGCEDASRRPGEELRPYLVRYAAVSQPEDWPTVVVEWWCRVCAGVAHAQDGLYLGIESCEPLDDDASFSCADTSDNRHLAGQPVGGGV